MQLLHQAADQPAAARSSAAAGHLHLMAALGRGHQGGLVVEGRTGWWPSGLVFLRRGRELFGNFPLRLTGDLVNEIERAGRGARGAHPNSCLGGLVGGVGGLRIGGWLGGRLGGGLRRLGGRLGAARRRRRPQAPRIRDVRVES